MALALRTRSEIESAATERGAIAAMRRFVSAFADPHFRLLSAWPEPIASALSLFDPADDGARPDRATAPEEAVALLGYAADDLEFRVDFDSTGTFERLPGSGPFPAGVLRLPSGRRVGVIRIAAFGDDRYPDVAAETWSRFRETLEGPCDAERAAAFSREVARDLLARLAARIREAKAAGAEAMLVDLTGNGGGREWCDAAARLFSEKPLFAPRGAPIRHPHWVPQLEGSIARVDAALAAGDFDASDRAALETEKTRLERVLALVRDVPDRRALFRERGAAVPPILAMDDGTRLPPAVATRAGLLPPAPEQGVFGGDLFVLTDRGTASASEHFVSMLADSGAATIVGSRTYGAGHGYTNGGIVLGLFGGRVTVRAPDAARLRRDGTNEAAGIEPDRRIEGFDDAGAAERARRVVQILE